MTGIRTREKKILNLSDLFILGFIVASLFFPMNMAMAAKKSGEMVLLSVLPTVFPFLVLGQILVLSDLSEGLGKYFGFLMPTLFALPKATFPVLLLGLFAGFPVGATMTEQLYVQGRISKNEGERLIAFSNNASFAFVVGVVGGTLLHSVAYGALLYVSSVAAAFCVGMLLSLFAKEKSFFAETTRGTIPKSRVTILVRAVRNGVRTSVEILGFVVFFGVVIELLKSTRFFFFLEWFGTAYGEIMRPIVYGLFDMTNGVFAVLQSSENLRQQLLSLAFVLGFSSLSVLFQIISVVLDHGFSMTFLFVGKVLQGIFSVIFVYVFSKLPVFAKATFYAVEALPNFSLQPSGAILLFAVSCIICMLLFWQMSIGKCKIF